jgi:radical SAM protein with 4Fe4S-binding SPASM domain
MPFFTRYNLCIFTERKRETQWKTVVDRMKKLRSLFSKAFRLGTLRRVPLEMRVKYLAPERPRRFPAQIQIEATSKCNFRCPSCSHARENAAGQHLSQADFRNILDRLPWRPKSVILRGIGEPLLNPNFFAMIDILAEKGIRCEFNTNGSLLKPAMWPEILSRSNIDSISISFDGAKADTFESLRVGGNFDNWQQLVRGFLARAKSEGRNNLTVSANVVVSRPNLSEIGQIVRLAAEMGFNHVSILDPIPFDGLAMSMCPSRDEVVAARKEVTDLADSLGLKSSCYLRRLHWTESLLPRCMMPWEYVFIRANGDVAPCCALFGSDKEAVMGNLFRQDFLDIWNGDAFRRYRRENISGKNPRCSVCPYH